MRSRCLAFEKQVAGNGVGWVLKLEDDPQNGTATGHDGVETQRRPEPADDVEAVQHVALEAGIGRWRLCRRRPRRLQLLPPPGSRSCLDPGRTWPARTPFGMGSG